MKFTKMCPGVFGIIRETTTAKKEFPCDKAILRCQLLAVDLSNFLPEN